MSVFGIAYRVTNLLNGKQYIGVTKGFSAEARWRRHCEPRSECRALRNAIQKYGKESFLVEVLASASDASALLDLERQLVAQEGTIVPNGYNLNAGGRGSLTPAAETRKRISDSLLGNQRTKGATLSPEHRDKLSRATKGRPKLPGHGPKIAAALRGMPHSLERRRNQSSAKLGKGIVPWNRGPKNARYWICRCECGTTKMVEGLSLRLGKTKSCGCWNREQARERAIIRNQRRPPANVVVVPPPVPSEPVRPAGIITP